MLGWMPVEARRQAQLEERVERELKTELVQRLVREKPLFFRSVSVRSHHLVVSLVGR